MGWIIFFALAVPILGVIAWVVFDESLVRIPPGQLGLLLIKGRATDTALEPGPHWVPAMRQRMVQAYPSVEMSYRAAGVDAPIDGVLERSGPPLRAALADRSVAVATYTVRFRLAVEGLRTVHERFGPEGIWSAVRDVSDGALRAELGDTEVDDLFGAARAPLEARLGARIGAELAATGVVLTMFHLGDVDLGRTGEVMAATSRARHELAREQAEAEMRVARARIDADVAPLVGADGGGPRAALPRGRLLA